MLNALVFSLLLLAPQQTPEKVLCTVYGIQPSRIFVACPGAEDLSVKREDWPEEWYEPRILQRYKAEVLDGKVYPVLTLEPVETRDPVRAHSLAEIRRWRIQPTQRSGGPK